MGHFEVHTQEGYVMHLCTKFEADRSIYSKVIRGSTNFEIGSRDPGHVQEGCVLYACTKFEADSSMRSKGVPKFRNWVT